ncbi:hypothetical protein PSM7751_00091 [Pseudooceanicola marinus]|uniref:Outer membrane protein beta-barrel domain-containing protein n=1 Tax=Pseudooceanicola marinus TaxID=396013 RepID=A0A1X6Y4R0_9RHOB|nr:outer membrane beta-barrel protein [Pseudooceanicola marinus]PJE33373.1 porin family protein [Pseudooceanicola marinus]SLN10580.1 hypothetical protein PSM7751_00091 [Pseudooceanicola marinus]
MFRFAVATAVLGLLSSPALAGNPVAPVIGAAPLMAPAAPVSDWTGIYAGVTLGTGRSDTSLGGYGIDVALDHDTRGLFLCYRHDVGAWVLGAELAYDQADVDGLGEPARYDLSVQAGYDAGRVLPYVALGVAKLELTPGDETGHFVGLGIDVKLTERVVLGAEARRTWFADDFLGVPGADMQADTLLMRLAFRF